MDNRWLWEFIITRIEQDGYEHREGKNFFRVLWDRDMKAWYWQNETTSEEGGPFLTPDDAQKDAQRCYEGRLRV